VTPNTAYICATCGVQHAPSEDPPATCPICEDERQYVGPRGQRWTTLEEMRGRHTNRLVELEPDLIRIDTEPAFAIGQSAYLIRTPHGNVLWDCLSYIDGATADDVRAVGGVSAIAISHPHFYASCVEWSQAFGDAPIYLPAIDAKFVMRQSERIIAFGEDEQRPLPDVRLIRVGGHFHGSTVLLWPAGAEGRGVLLTGDSIAVAADRRWVTFLYSYPNRIPLAASEVRDVATRVEDLGFDRLYAGWADDVIPTGARAAVLRSADRYVAMLEGTWPRQ
jgi:glyoxylase-like metal-dependent hydrolase (beta-lactamase superfamily II)